jgi:hypothetical protein
LCALTAVVAYPSKSPTKPNIRHWCGVHNAGHGGDAHGDDDGLVKGGKEGCARMHDDKVLGRNVWRRCFFQKAFQKGRRDVRCAVPKQSDSRALYAFFFYPAVSDYREENVRVL